MQFTVGKKYSRDNIHRLYIGKPMPRIGTGLWTSGYLTVPGTNDFVVFMNIGTSGTTGHNFPNQYDPKNETVIWFGKPDTHQNQKTFLNLANGNVTAHFFGRWNNKDTEFEYLGIGSQFKFEDGFLTTNSKGVNTTCVKVTLSLNDNYRSRLKAADENLSSGKIKVEQINFNGEIVMDYDLRPPRSKNNILNNIFEKTLGIKHYHSSDLSYEYDINGKKIELIFCPIVYAGTGTLNRKRVQISYKMLDIARKENVYIIGVYLYDRNEIFCHIDESFENTETSSYTSRYLLVEDLLHAKKKLIHRTSKNYLVFTSNSIKEAFQEILGMPTNFYETKEGKKLIVQHTIRERDKKIIKLKKIQFLEENNSLYCECCGFNFEEKYGQRGNDFIEVHHTKFLSELNEEETTSLEDLILVCSNCHKMIHRFKPWLSIAELKKIITA